MAGSDFEFYEGLDRCMGTQFRLYAFYAPERTTWMHKLADRLFDALEADDRRLSLYVADSLVNRINREAGREPVALDPDTFALLAAARGYWESTGGLFDITAGALMLSYGYYREAALPPGEIPRPEELPELTGCDKLELDSHSLTARLARPGMRLDLGGIAKGWCVQRRAAILGEAGLADFVVSAGTSTVLARGAPPEREAWPTVLEPLGDRNQAGEETLLTDCAVSVSANYRHTLQGPEGSLVRHIMNPLTRQPVKEVRRVTVVGPDAAECEALSTAYLIQGGLTGVFSLPPKVGLSVRFELGL